VDSSLRYKDLLWKLCLFYLVTFFVLKMLMIGFLIFNEQFETQEFNFCLGLRFVEKTSRILWAWFWQLQPISFDFRETLLSCCWFRGLNKWVNDCIYKHFELIKVWRFLHVREFCQRVKFGIFYKAVCEGTLALIPISWL